MLENYSFEVFWKDEKTAHVQVENETVNVERFTEHPLKQLFAEEKMSRYQLNRCAAGTEGVRIRTRS